jgi:glycosyltransferase involved in cell wall biosynthesis
MKKSPFSVAIVCMNEEDRIGQCLKSVSFANEIIVVDSGSTDNTLDIVKKHTDKIFSREWKGWKDQKSWAANQCSNQWVLTLDADEVVSDELAGEIQKVVFDDNNKYAGFTIPRKTYYQGKWIRHCGWYPDRKLRFYKKDLAKFAGTDPHEEIEVEGTVAEFKGDLIHYTYRNLEHQAKQMINYGMVNAKAKSESGAGSSWFDMAFRPAFAFFKTYVLQLGFLDGVPGLIISFMNAHYTLIKYARLWELGKKD